MPVAIRGIANLSAGCSNGLISLTSASALQQTTSQVNRAQHLLHPPWHTLSHGQQQRAGAKTRASHKTFRFVDAPGPVDRHKFRRVVLTDSISLRRAESNESNEPIEPVDASSKPKKILRRRETSTEALEAELQWIAHKNPHPIPIEKILRILVEERGVIPKQPHYEALILANCHADFGSFDAVKSVLQQMEKANISMSAGISVAILKVLAVHPDHALRTTTLNEMKQRWIQLSPDAECCVVAGLIGEGQVELAQHQIYQMQQRKLHVPPWIFVLLMRRLCEMHDFEGALRLSYTLHDEGIQLPRSLWLATLEATAQNGCYQLARWIWMQMVEVILIKPDSNCCHNVLQLAVKELDIKLAESVMLVLQQEDSELAQRDQQLVDEMYTKLGTKRDPDRSRRGNLHPLFSKEKGLENAYFDPWVALSKRLVPKSNKTKSRYRDVTYPDTKR